MKFLCKSCTKYVECRHAFGKYHSCRSHGGVGCDLLFDVPRGWLTPQQYEDDRARFAKEDLENERGQSVIDFKQPKIDVFNRLSKLKQMAKQ